MSDSRYHNSKCPFCGFSPGEDPYELLLHIETLHSEGQSPFVVSPDPFVCPRTSCGELLSQNELAYHLDLHKMQDGEMPTPLQESQPASSSRTRRPSRASSARAIPQKQSSRQGIAIKAWKAIFEGHRSRSSTENKQRVRHRSKKHVDVGQISTSTTSNLHGSGVARVSIASQAGQGGQSFTRLGRSELGRFAHEQRMPDWLVTLLQDEGQIVNKGIIPVLTQLLEQNPSTQCAFLCHSSVQHVSKLRREGGFCGYRNIQMLVSYIVGAQATGHDKFSTTFPTIFQIQDLIENAWDAGFNAQGRIETGGIRGTRKYIGTPEAYAVFCSLGIPCLVGAFKEKEAGKSKNLLLEAVERYFQAGVSDVNARVHCTNLPPIYLQHPGHSLTIVGFEKQTDGQTNLLVFDPSFRDSGVIHRLVGTVFRHRPTAVGETLQPYRRGSSYLRRYNEFEVLSLTNPAIQ